MVFERIWNEAGFKLGLPGVFGNPGRWFEQSLSVGSHQINYRVSEDTFKDGLVRMAVVSGGGLAEPICLELDTHLRPELAIKQAMEIFKESLYEVC